MANQLLLRRSAVPGNVPTTSQLALGELGINTFDGKLFLKKNNGADSIVEVGAAGAVAAIGYAIDGNGAAISTGVAGMGLSVPFNCIINSWTLLADVTGSIVVDIWKDTLANFPPTIADVITASAKPTLSSARTASSSTLTGWTTAINAGDVLFFNVNSCLTITKATLILKVTKT